MTSLKFDKWVRAAVSRIVFPPDRWEVERELKGHLQDCYEESLLLGMTPEEAEILTLEAMGPPEAIAGELGLIHRPFWGRFHQTTKWLAAAMVCLTVFAICAYLLNGYVFHTFSSPVYYRYDPFEDTYAFDDAGTYRLSTSGDFFSVSYSDGYLFILRRYALWQETHAVSLQQEDRMYLQAQVISLIPWSDQTDIFRWFRAEDNLGNRYDAAYAHSDQPTLRSSVYHTAPGVYTHILSFTDYRSVDASQLELLYDRAGRNIRLSIDLTGGAK